MARAKQHRSAERRRLEDGVQPRGMKTASDIRDVRDGVEVAQDSVPIYENDVGVRGAGCVDSRERERARAGPGLDRALMRVARFVGGDDEPRVGNLVADSGPGGEQVLLVGGPRRTRDQGRARRAQSLNESRWDEPRARPHLVEAGVARHADAIGPHPQAAEPFRVALSDCPDAIEQAIGIPQKGSGEKSTTPRRFGKRRAYHSDRNARGCRPLGERGPDVELAENERLGPQRGDYRVGVVEGVKGEVVGEIRRHRLREVLGAGRIKSVCDLDIRATRAQELDDGQRLESFADRWCVEPDEWPGAVASGGAPALVAIDESAAATDGATEFGFAGGNYADERVGCKPCERVGKSQQRLHGRRPLIFTAGAL